LLARLGEDLAGAVVVTPLTELDEEELPRPNLESSPMSGPLRFSLAGVQAKFSVVRDADKFTFPARGAGGDWIVKLPDLQFESVPENEFSMLTWARAAGITVPEFHLVDSNDIAGLPAIAGHRPGPSLAVERFDRSPDRRIHIEDFAQVFAVFPEAKYDHFNYESIANVIAVTCGEASLREYVRRLVFMVVSGNADMHLKNWSLRYVDVSRPELAPAYDFVATVAYGDVKRELALNFSKSRSFDAVDAGHFHRLFQRLRRDPNEADRWVSEDLERIATAWSSLRDQLPIARAVRDAIDAHQRRVALLAHVRG
jgi:serine/threonine-protein kinase HipA